MTLSRRVLLFGFLTLTLGFSCYCKSEEDIALNNYLMGQQDTHIFNPMNGITKVDDESIMETEPEKPDDAVKKINSAAKNKFTKTKGKQSQYKATYLKETTSEVLRALAKPKKVTHRDDEYDKCGNKCLCGFDPTYSIIFTVMALIMRELRKIIDECGLDKEKERERLEKLKKQGK